MKLVEETEIKSICVICIDQKLCSFFIERSEISLREIERVLGMRELRLKY